MKVKEIIEFVNDPIIVYRNYNMGKISTLTKPMIKSVLKSEIDWIEGVGTSKQVVVYINDN